MIEESTTIILPEQTVTDNDELCEFNKLSPELCAILNLHLKTPDLGLGINPAYVNDKPVWIQPKTYNTTIDASLMIKKRRYNHNLKTSDSSFFNNVVNDSFAKTLPNNGKTKDAAQNLSSQSSNPLPNYIATKNQTQQTDYKPSCLEQTIQTHGTTSPFSFFSSSSVSQTNKTSNIAVLGCKSPDSSSVVSFATDLLDDGNDKDEPGIPFQIPFEIIPEISSEIIDCPVPVIQAKPQKKLVPIRLSKLGIINDVPGASISDQRPWYKIRKMRENKLYDS